MHHDALRILPAQDDRKPDRGSSRARNSQVASPGCRSRGSATRSRRCLRDARRGPARRSARSRGGRRRSGGCRAPAPLRVRLLGLAGEERVEALVGGADQVVAGGPGRDGEAPDPLGAGREDERLAPESVGDTGASSATVRSATVRRGRSCRTGLAVARSSWRAARRCRASRARRGRGGRRPARRSRGTGPRVAPAGAGQQRAARCARRSRDGRAPCRRRRPQPARTARATRTSTERAASPRRRRRPGGPGGANSGQRSTSSSAFA